jgi:hypothetical protein
MRNSDSVVPEYGLPCHFFQQFRQRGVSSDEG